MHASEALHLRKQFGQLTPQKTVRKPYQLKGK